MILSSFINLQPLQYQDYIYPPMANLLGIIFALSSVSAIPLVGIWMLAQAKGDTFREVILTKCPIALILADLFKKFRNALRPTADRDLAGGGLGPLLRPEMVRATRVTFARVNARTTEKEEEEMITAGGGGRNGAAILEELHSSAEHDDVLL